MPIYEYRCQSCDHQQEHLQKLNEAPIAQCPECGSSHYVKLLSAAGFAFKGDGWYVTDYKGSNQGGTKESANSAGCGQGTCQACAAATQ